LASEIKQQTSLSVVMSNFVFKIKSAILYSHKNGNYKSADITPGTDAKKKNMLRTLNMEQ